MIDANTVYILTYLASCEVVKMIRILSERIEPTTGKLVQNGKIGGRNLEISRSKIDQGHRLRPTKLMLCISYSMKCDQSFTRSPQAR